MKLLLDTHALLRMSIDDPQLSDNAREITAVLGNELWLHELIENQGSDLVASRSALA